MPDDLPNPTARAGSPATAGSVAGENALPDRACWCGEKNPYYAPQPNCDGHRYTVCLCGGDFCVCHHHGEAECFGCSDCEDDQYDDD